MADRLLRLAVPVRSAASVSDSSHPNGNEQRTLTIVFGSLLAGAGRACAAACQAGVSCAPGHCKAENVPVVPRMTARLVSVRLSSQAHARA